MTAAGAGGPPGRRVAVVLAAGASRRFAGSPKATLDVDGEPAVRRIVRLALAEGLVPVVVTGPHDAAIRASVGPLAAEIVPNAEWAAGRTGSVQAGISAAGTPELTVVWPVDHPFVEALSLRAVVRSAEDDPMALWVIPTYRGHGGHPIVLKPSTFAKIRALAPDAPLRSLLPGLGPQVRRVPVDDPGVLANVDTPEEYERYRAARREGRWTGD